ncbi:MAG: histone deacetylase [Burkholderiales bacterium]|nr:histone deacetylase [Burkholderiales bacterium]
MNIFYNDHFVLPLPPGHRFPMQKYALLRAAVQAWAPHALHEAPAASEDELRLAHTADYVRRMLEGALSEQEVRRIGFPWSPPMAERARRSVGATIAAARAALRDGIAVNLAGGTHHAHADHGEGFCCFNDVAVATRVLQRERAVERVLICDLDVHQGNGTAAIFAGDASVFTFSMHGERNFPARKEASTLDVALPDGCTDEDYLAALRAHLPGIVDRFRPQMVFYLAGADPYVGDRLGRLALSKAGLAERDRMVLRLARDTSLPVAVTMAGGYADEVDDIVDIHFNTVRTAFEVFP